MIIFASSNRNKFSRFQRAMLDLPVEMEDFKIPEPQELSIADIASHKAKHAYAKCQQPVAVEDSGLCIPAKNYWPGALTKPTFDMLGGDIQDPELTKYEQVNQFLALTSSLHGKQRDCFFMRALAFADIDGNIDVIVSQHERGHLLTAPQDGPHGWSNISLIFKADGYTTSMAAMTAEEVKENDAKWWPDDVAVRFARLVHANPASFGYLPQP